MSYDAIHVYSCLIYEGWIKWGVFSKNKYVLCLSKEGVYLVCFRRAIYGVL